MSNRRQDKGLEKLSVAFISSLMATMTAMLVIIPLLGWVVMLSSGTLGHIYEWDNFFISYLDSMKVGIIFLCLKIFWGSD